MNRNILFASLLVAAGVTLPVQAQEAGHDMTRMMATGLMMARARSQPEGGNSSPLRIAWSAIR